MKTRFAAATALLATVASRTAHAQGMALPSAPSGTTDPVETMQNIIQYGLDGIMLLGAGAAFASLAFALAKTIAGGQFDSRRVAIVTVAGAGLAGVGFLGDLVIGA